MDQSTEQTMTGELVEFALRDLAGGNSEQLRDALTEVHHAAGRADEVRGVGFVEPLRTIEFQVGDWTPGALD